MGSTIEIYCYYLIPKEVGVIQTGAWADLSFSQLWYMLFVLDRAIYSFYAKLSKLAAGCSCTFTKIII